MTTEEKLKAFIKASQTPILGDWTWQGEHIETNYHCIGLLDLLLDPEGLREAYGEKTPKDYGVKHHGFSEYWLEVSHRILDSWLFVGPEKAIDTAYDLLPRAVD